MVVQNRFLSHSLRVMSRKHWALVVFVDRSFPSWSVLLWWYVESPPRPLQQRSCLWCSQERRKAKARRPTGSDLPHRGCSALP
jgi:hypothetical protein